MLLIGLLLLLLAAYQDYKNQETYDVIVGGFCIVNAVNTYINDSHALAFISVCICLFVLSIPDLPCIGGADGAVFSGILAVVGVYDCIVIVGLSASLALIIYAIEKYTSKSYFVKGKRISMIPVITIVFIPVLGQLNYG